MYQGAREAFNEQCEKLKANYADDKFPAAKCALIWEELKDFSPKQIRNICWIVMGENTYAPNVNAFREKASMLREKIRQWERQQEKQDAHDFWAGTYHDDDVKKIVATIKDRIEGRCDDATWAEFQKFIGYHANGTEPVKCKKCEDTTVYYDGQMKPTVCRCFYERKSG